MSESLGGCVAQNWGLYDGGGRIGEGKASPADGRQSSGQTRDHHRGYEVNDEVRMTNGIAGLVVVDRPHASKGGLHGPPATCQRAKTEESSALEDDFRTLLISTHL